jgi:hypothetical protein
VPGHSNADDVRAALRAAGVPDSHIIAAEGAQVCELCGKSAETRPYGPKGEEVCFPCGVKDEAAAGRVFERRMAGE